MTLTTDRQTSNLLP